LKNLVFFLFSFFSRWVAIRLDFAGNFIAFFAAFFAVISRNERWGISAEEVGLSISYALSVTQVLHWLVRSASELESNVVSVERIVEYSNVETEAPWVIDNARPEKNWPPSGQIHFSDYQTR
jgi:ABC-type multidrug transport system fused ATPase/permease subunit